MSAAQNGADRARAWRWDMLAAVCDSVTPWEYGTVARATRYPQYYDLNLVILERPCGLGAAELADVTAQLLAGLAHGRIDIEDPYEARRLRPQFEALGWRTMWLVRMLLGTPVGSSAGDGGVPVDVVEVPYDAVMDLRREWQVEDFPAAGDEGFHAYAREVALARGCRVLAVLDDGRPVAYAQLDGRGPRLEIGEVFVTRPRRGERLGTAVTAAAIKAARGAEELWIAADDEDRPKRLYERLGFRPVWWTLELLRLPDVGAGGASSGQ